MAAASASLSPASSSTCSWTTKHIAHGLASEGMYAVQFGAGHILRVALATGHQDKQSPANGLLCFPTPPLPPQ